MAQFRGAPSLFQLSVSSYLKWGNRPEGSHSVSTSSVAAMFALFIKSVFLEVQVSQEHVHRLVPGTNNEQPKWGRARWGSLHGDTLTSPGSFGALPLNVGVLGWW